MLMDEKRRGLTHGVFGVRMRFGAGNGIRTRDLLLGKRILPARNALFRIWMPPNRGRDRRYERLHAWSRLISGVGNVHPTHTRHRVRWQGRVAEIVCDREVE